MPSKEFMQEILTRGQVNDEPPSLEEPDEQPSDEPADEVVEAEPEQAEQEAEGDPDADREAEEGEEPGADDDGEAEEEPQAHEDEFYVSRYKTREEAERGIEETRRFGQENRKARVEAERENEELRRRVAFLEGRDSARGGEEEGGDGSFEDWADQHIETNPEQGMREAIQASIQSNDPSYAYAYTDRWAATDQYQASVWRNRLETMVFQAQHGEVAAEPEEPVAPQGREVQDTAWRDFAEIHPEANDPAARAEIARILVADERWLGVARSGDPDLVPLAFEHAWAVYTSTRNGPRRLRKADAEQVEREKRAATLTSGDGAPQRRSSSPDLTDEEQSILAGAERLGLKRRA